MKKESNNMLLNNPSKVNEIIEYPLSEQSANTFFHFMNKQKFLKEILNDKKIYPRFCKEDISNLDLDIKSITIAMKCFCNIPLHLVNNHRNEYGNYCIGLKKEWGIKNGLQPVIYYNIDSEFKTSFKTTYEAAMAYVANDEILINMAELINHTFKYMKPIMGLDPKTKKLKDFTDEKEWRFVPNINCPEFSEIIIDDTIDNPDVLELYNATIKKEGYCLNFDYKDIKYLFVKKSSNRKSLIKVIEKLECSQEEKNYLISKIC
ncbi:MAG: abortive infection system antitoxin AbiGi family protein, partial [Erysipelotrichaceae bacterium]|nr:abortive infection system antitoxin AbiGi family protein [Erysipelotrichaceae bacterium]